MRDNQSGFTLIEVIIALVILTAALMIMPMAGMRFTQTVAENRMRNEANALADAWVARCRAEPNYAALDSTVAGKCAATATNLGSYGFTRSTTINTDASLSGVADSLNDYKRITVTISGGGLSTPVTRTVTIARF